MKKTIIAIIILVILGAGYFYYNKSTSNQIISQPINQEKNMNTENNVHYLLSLDLENCNSEIRLNDVPMNVGIGSPLTIKIPVSQWIVPGNNTVEIIDNKIERGMPSSSSSCAVSLIKKSDDTESIIKEINGGNTSVSMVLDQDYPRWSYLDSQTIINSPETALSLYGEYKKLHNLFETKDKGAITSYFSVYLEEMVLANSTSKDEELSEILGLVDDTDVSLYKLVSLDQLHLQVFGNSHLARLLSKKNKSPIVYVENDKSAGYYIDMIYMKTDRGWIKVR